MKTITLILWITVLALQARNIDIYIGQSNMTGRMPSAEVQHNHNHIYGWDGATRRWVQNPHPTTNHDVFHLQVRDGYDPAALGFAGPELICSSTISASTPGSRHIIKYSWGGSAISLWHPDAGPHYARIRGMCNAARVSPADNVTVFFMQGESDTAPSLSKKYLAALVYLESRLRRDVHMDRFIVGRITTEPWATYGTPAAAQEVREAQENFEYVDTDQYPKALEAADGENLPAHYSAEGTRMLGYGFAMQYLHRPVHRYRMYNTTTAHHYLASSRGECLRMQRNGWVLEDGKYAYSLPSKSAMTTPLYRAYNPDPISKEYFWTADASEYKSIRGFGWKGEGIDGHVFVTAVTGAVPLYRFHNPVTFLHHWTVNPEEKDWLVLHGWTYEGVAGYVIK